MNRRFSEGDYDEGLYGEFYENVMTEIGEVECAMSDSDVVFQRIMKGIKKECIEVKIDDPDGEEGVCFNNV